LPGFSSSNPEHDWLDDWQVTRGAALDTGNGVIVSNPDGTFGQIDWRGGAYTNSSAEQQFLWIPIVYRTDTPTRPGDGDPVATVLAGDRTFNLYTTDRDLHYKDIIVTVDPGETVNISMLVGAGKSIDILAFGTLVNIADILSPENPAYALDVDLSGLPADYRAQVDLQYSLMVNPYLTNEILTGTDGNDQLSGTNGDNQLIGGGGDDVMTGGAGNDTYYVDSLGDVVIENPGEGDDTVVTTVAGFILPANVEHIVFHLTGGLADDTPPGA